MITKRAVNNITNPVHFGEYETKFSSLVSRHSRTSRVHIIVVFNLFRPYTRVCGWQAIHCMTANRGHAGAVIPPFGMAAACFEYEKTAFESLAELCLKKRARA